MLLGEPLASLITFFKTRLIKFHHNSQRMPDSLYHITESSEISKEIVMAILHWKQGRDE